MTSTRGLAIPETEAAAQQDVVRGDRVIFEDARDAVKDQVVDADGVLWRIDGATKVRITDRVRRIGPTHPAGSIIVREGREPGDSSLWLISRHGDDPLPLAPGDGASDMPFVLPDGRVVFVSTRSSVAAIWIVDVASAEVRQLTNIGLVVGRPWKNFVPTPAESFGFADGVLRYDAGGDQWWRVHPDTGAAEREAQ